MTHISQAANRRGAHVFGERGGGKGQAEGNGAEGGTRTPTGCPTRPSNVRVCQFRHFGPASAEYAAPTRGLSIAGRRSARGARHRGPVARAEGDGGSSGGTAGQRPSRIIRPTRDCRRRGWSAS